MPDVSGEQPKPENTNESLADFFRVKFAKDASSELITFLEKPGKRDEIPANLIKPALTLLGISETIVSLSDDQVLDCVERSCRSLLKDLNDFKAGSKQQVAERAKNAITRLNISLTSPTAIRAAVSKPKPTVAKVVPQAASLPVAQAPVATPTASTPVLPNPFATAAPAIPTLKTTGKKKQGPSGLLLAGAGTAVAVVIGIGAVLVLNSLNKPPEPVAQSSGDSQPKPAPPITPPATEQKTAPPTIPKVVPPSPSANIPEKITPKPTPAPAEPTNPAPPPPANLETPAANPPDKPEVPAPPETPAVSPTPETNKVTIDKAEFDRMRASLRDAVKDTAEAEKVDAILAFSANPEISKSPAALKAVLAEALVQSLTTKDLPRAQTTLRRIQDSAELFADNEYKVSVARVKDLAAANNQRVFAWGLIEHLSERKLLTPAEVISEKAAALSLAAQDKELKKPANQAQRQELAEEMLALAIEAAETQPEVADELLVESRKTAGAIVDRERRAAFEKEINAVKATVAEAKKYQQALEQLKVDPQDAGALKIRIDVQLKRGHAKEILADLARSEHSLKSVAQETVTLLEQGANVAGKSCFNCAQQWAKAAEESQGAKRTGLQELARELTTLAISAQTDPLDPFAMQRAKQLEATIAISAPTVPVTTAKSTSTDPKPKVVDLLVSGAKTSVVKGNINRTKDAIVADRGLFEFDQELKERSYRLVAKFARTNGGDTMGITIPVGTHAVTVVFGAYNNVMHGLSDLEQGGPDRNPTGVRGAIENNRLYIAQIDVQQLNETDYHIVVLLDGAKIIDWQGSQDRLVPSSRTEYAGSSLRKLVAGATKCTMEVRGLELSVPATAAGKSPKGKPLPLNKWVDLLPLVDVDEDCERGYWSPGPANSFKVGSDPLSVLRMPILLANCSYDLAVEFKTDWDHDQVHVLFPVGDRKALLVVNGYENAKMSYFEMIAGQKAMDNKNVLRANLLEPHQTYRYEINVRLKGERATLTFNLNGKKVFEHEGPIAELSTMPVWEIGTLAQPALVAHETHITYLNCQVTPVSGTASLGRDVPLLEQIPEKILALKAMPLTSLQYLEMKVHDNHFGINKGPRNPFVGGKECTDFIYIHAPSRITYAIPPNSKYFTTIAYCPMSSHVDFIVKVDGKKLFSRARRPVTPIVVELPAGGKVLELECDSLGELVRDNSFWCYPSFR